MAENRRTLLGRASRFGQALAGAVAQPMKVQIAGQAEFIPNLSKGVLEVIILPGMAILAHADHCRVALSAHSLGRYRNPGGAARSVESMLREGQEEGSHARRRRHMDWEVLARARFGFFGRLYRSLFLVLSFPLSQQKAPRRALNSHMKRSGDRQTNAPKAQIANG